MSEPAAPPSVAPTPPVMGLAMLCRRCGAGMPPRTPCPNCGWRVTDKYGVVSSIIGLGAPISFLVCGLPAIIGFALGLASLGRLFRQPHLRGMRWALFGTAVNGAVLAANIFIGSAVLRGVTAPEPAPEPPPAAPVEVTAPAPEPEPQPEAKSEGFFEGLGRMWRESQEAAEAQKAAEAEAEAKRRKLEAIEAKKAEIQLEKDRVEDRRSSAEALKRIQAEEAAEQKRLQEEQAREEAIPQ